MVWKYVSKTEKGKEKGLIGIGWGTMEQNRMERSSIELNGMVLQSVSKRERRKIKTDSDFRGLNAYKH